MAASPVQPPNVDEVSYIADLFEKIRDWGWAILLPIVMGVAWQLSRLYTKVENALTEHDEAIETHHEELNKLRSSHFETEKKVAEMPTRSEFREWRMEFVAHFDQLNRRLDEVLKRRGD